MNDRQDGNGGELRQAVAELYGRVANLDKKLAQLDRMVVGHQVLIKLILRLMEDDK